MTTTIILGSASDIHVNQMSALLQRSDRHTLIINTEDLTTGFHIDWRPDTNEGHIATPTIDLPFSDIKSVYWNTLSSPKLNENKMSAGAACNWSSLLRTLLSEPSIRWVNGWNAYIFHKIKPRQLALAQSLGATIPHTYTGNSFIRAQLFLSQHEQVIIKPLHGGSLSQHFVSSDISINRLRASLVNEPTTIQNFIAGTNIRTFVIGQHIYSAEINSSYSDFRQDNNPQIIPIVTPSNIAKLSIKIMRACHMHWTAIDWRRTPCGKYFFLEANPSPMFIDFEAVTEFPIAEKLTQLLL